jgi:hypothetical protein
VSQRMLKRLAGSLLVAGMFFNFIVSAFHPFTEDPNDHPAVFAQYAADDSWKAVHFGQFASGVIVVAGLIVLYQTLARTGRVDTLARLAVAGAVATLAAVAVLQAIDGVALKQAVDAWANAPGSEMAAAFRDAETVRWMEWGANSYFRLLQGITVLLYGLAVAWSAIASRWLGWIGVVAGLGYMAVGVIVGYEGFSDASLNVGSAMDLLFFIVAAGIAAAGWRRREPVPAGG